MSDMQRLDVILKHVYTEPRTKAILEWSGEYSVGGQMTRQIEKPAMQHYLLMGKWPDPDQRIEIERHEEPDWDWWEPRHDQPWRRKQARDRELDAKLEAVR